MKEILIGLTQRWPVMPVALVIAFVGCSFDSSGLKAKCDGYKGVAPILACDSWNQEPAIDLNGKTACYAPQAGATKVNRDGGLRVNEQVYCDPIKWRISKIGLPGLAGSLWIRPPYTMNVNDAESGGVQFKVLNDTVEAVYLAYDSRYKTPPDWLKAPEWEKQNALPNKGWLADEPPAITIEKPNTLTGESFVNLEIWKAKKVPLPGEDYFKIQGNLYGKPIWPDGLKPSDVAMYVVIIQPKRVYDCSKANPTEPATRYTYNNCADLEVQLAPNTTRCKTPQEFEAEAKAWIEAKLKKDYPSGTHTIGPIVAAAPPPNCVDGKWAKIIFDLTQQPLLYEKSSIVQFDFHSSRADVDVAGETDISRVTGTLDFDYLLDGDKVMKMRVNDLALQLLYPLMSNAYGVFSDIQIQLLNPLTADCTDAIVPYRAPCKTYRILSGEFLVSARAVHDGQILVLAARNSGPIDVSTDDVTRTVHFEGGPITGNIKVGDEDVPVTFSVDLTGEFVDLAPQAVTVESTRSVECVEGKNGSEVPLNSAGSFRLYGDPLPTVPAAYQWYEDYGLVTQKSLGQGPKVIIPKYLVSFGTHVISLVLRDDFGIAAINTFPLDVRDTKAPNLTIPGDIIRIVVPPDTVPIKIDPGQASASDACSLTVMITNDAPAGNLFPAGKTIITWTADDGTGNVTTKTQSVIVVPNLFLPLIMKDLTP
jgi:hypothetical protein